MSDLEDTVAEVVDRLEKGNQELPEREGQEPEIKLNRKGETPKGYPFFHVRKGESCMHYCHVPDQDILYISMVWMEYDNDFTDLMDFVVEEHGTNHIKFTMVVNNGLKKALTGFEEKQEYHENVDEIGTVLEGEWNQ